MACSSALCLRRHGEVTLFANGAEEWGAISTPAPPDELKQIHQHRIKAHADRETAAALNLLRAVKLGEALRDQGE